jgi:hypothetical protein
MRTIYKQHICGAPSYTDAMKARTRFLFFILVQINKSSH